MYFSNEVNKIGAGRHQANPNALVNLQGMNSQSIPKFSPMRNDYGIKMENAQTLPKRQP